MFRTKNNSRHKLIMATLYATSDLYFCYALGLSEFCVSLAESGDVLELIFLSDLKSGKFTLDWLSSKKLCCVGLAFYLCNWYLLSKLGK